MLCFHEKSGMEKPSEEKSRSCIKKKVYLQIGQQRVLFFLSDIIADPFPVLQLIQDILSVLQLIQIAPYSVPQLIHAARPRALIDPSQFRVTFPTFRPPPSSLSLSLSLPACRA
jgi:hypothetical protein